MVIPLFCTILIGCKNDDDPVIPPDPSENQNNLVYYTVDSPSTLPGLFLSITANDGLVTKDTASVELGDKSVFLFKTDSLHYAFLVPVLSPGTYKLNLKKINGANSPEIIISQCKIITNPESVISENLKKYAAYSDSLLVGLPNNYSTMEDVNFMNQLIDQLEENIGLLNSQEKLLLAYEFQNNTELNSFTSKGNIQEPDIFNKLVAALFKAEGAKLKALGSTAAVGLSFAFLIAKPEPVAVVIFIFSILNYQKAIAKAREKYGESFNVIDYAIELFDNTAAKFEAPIRTDKDIVSNNQAIFKKFKLKLRTIRKSDETDLNGSLISNFIKGSYELEDIDAGVMSKFETIKNLLKKYFNKIINSYRPFVSEVLVTAKEDIVDLDSNSISVGNVSDSNIEITTADNGSNGLLLTFKNPSKNILENTDFTYQVKFSQEELSNSVFLIEEATFVPSKIILTTNSITSITATSALCTSNILYPEASLIKERGVCWGTGPKPTILDSKTSDGQGVGAFTSQLQDLLSGTKYYVRAYADTNEETFYGNEVSFVTTSSNSYDELSGTFIGAGFYTNYQGNGDVPYLLTLSFTVDQNGILTGNMGLDSYFQKMTGTTDGTTIAFEWVSPPAAPYKYSGTFSADKKTIEGSGGAGGYYAPDNANGPFKIEKQL